MYLLFIYLYILIFNNNLLHTICNLITTYRAIVNRAEEKVRKLLNEEEMKLWQRREKLNNLLQREEYELNQELVAKQYNEECRYCTERNNRVQKYEEEIEMEKARECLKALEREKM